MSAELTPSNGTPNGAAQAPATAPARRNGAPPWSVDDSRELYHVEAWGKGYFSVNDAGHVVVRPDQKPGSEIDLYDVVQGLKARELTTPVVVRFSGILAHRLRHLHDAFAQAIAENDYRNGYSAVDRVLSPENFVSTIYRKLGEKE